MAAGVGLLGLYAAGEDDYYGDGTTQSAIARLESGGRPPRIDTLLRVAEALDCELIVQLRPRTKREAE